MSEKIIIQQLKVENKRLNENDNDNEMKMKLKHLKKIKQLKILTLKY